MNVWISFVTLCFSAMIVLNRIEAQVKHHTGIKDRESDGYPTPSLVIAPH